MDPAARPRLDAPSSARRRQPPDVWHACPLMPDSHRPHDGHRPSLPVLAALLLVSLAVRPQLAAIGPLAGGIIDELGVSHAFVGLLTTVPVLCMGLFAPFGPPLARRLGGRRAIAARDRHGGAGRRPARRAPGRGHDAGAHVRDRRRDRAGRPDAGDVRPRDGRRTTPWRGPLRTRAGPRSGRRWRRRSSCRWRACSADGAERSSRCRCCRAWASWRGCGWCAAAPLRASPAGSPPRPGQAAGFRCCRACRSGGRSCGRSACCSACSRGCSTARMPGCRASTSSGDGTRPWPRCSCRCRASRASPASSWRRWRPATAPSAARC